MSARTMAVMVAVVVVLGCKPLHAERKPKAASPDAAAEREVTRLLKREATAPLDRRGSLQPLLKRLPDVEAARWHAGFTKTEKSWRSFDAPPDTAQTALLTDYGKRRSEAPQTVRGQLALAAWCGMHELKDEERAHRTTALIVASPAEQPPILKSLGYQQVDGEWRSPREARDWMRSAQEVEASLKRWGPEVERIVRQLQRNTRERGIARAALSEIKDPRAIPALEIQVGAHEPALLIEKLAQMPAHEASLSLARFAVFSDSAHARETATRALCGRRKEDFVPLLIQLLSSPITAQFAVGANRKGWVCESVLTRETCNRLQVWRSSKAYLPIINTFGLMDDGIVRNLGNSDLDSLMLPPTGLIPLPDARPLLEVEIANNASRSIGDQVHLSSRAANIQNESICELNRRVTVVLRGVTSGEEFKTASEWWDWWAAYSGQQEAGAKVVEEFAEVEVDRPVYPILRSVSCFHAGTPVWTVAGAKPIEVIRVGDRVLTQDVESGALEYKPVLQRTVGAPRRMIRVGAGDEFVTCTDGHRFWVAGEAWIKARDLTPKHLLHTARGTIPVESVTEADVDRTYNLVVADFHNYFVGKQAMLVQDLPLPRSTNCVVPGLQPEW